MTGQPAQTRKPYDPTPYSSLRPSEPGAAEPKPAAAGAAKHTPNEFDAEAERLRSLREALWMAFEAGPEAGLPNTLIDLTIAYTNALRLQLNLRSVSVRQLHPPRTLSPRAEPPLKA